MDFFIWTFINTFIRFFSIPYTLLPRNQSFICWAFLEQSADFLFASLGSHHTELSWFSICFSTTNPSFPSYSFTMAISQNSVSSVLLSFLCFSLTPLESNLYFIVSNSSHMLLSNVYFQPHVSTVRAFSFRYLIRLITSNSICPKLNLPSPLQKVTNIISTFIPVTLINLQFKLTLLLSISLSNCSRNPRLLSSEDFSLCF